MTKKIHIVFDGPPGPEGCRFVEVEDAEGNSIKIGEWCPCGHTPGYWILELEDPRALRVECDELLAALKEISVAIDTESAKLRAALHSIECAIARDGSDTSIWNIQDIVEYALTPTNTPTE